MEMPQAGAVVGRLDNVLRVIYLLFNEGYYSRSQDQDIKKGSLYRRRCGWVLLLTEYEMTDRP